MTLRMAIAGPADVVHVFGILGHAVGPRTGPGSRTHDEKEWWCLRRYIFTLSAAAQLEFPISITKRERPDFCCEFGPRSVGIEVTEATDAQDQKGMTKFQQSGLSQAWVGSFGGRFVRGAGNPALACERDVLEAVRSKSQHLDNYEKPLPEHVLLLYSNSNAASLIHDAMWPSVFSGCNRMNEQLWEQAPLRLKSIAVICGPWLMVLNPNGVSGPTHSDLGWTRRHESSPSKMTFQDENVVAFIAKLRTPGERKYAERQWRYVKGQNSQPDHRTFGVSDTDAQRIRMHLSGMK